MSYSSERYEAEQERSENSQDSQESGLRREYLQLPASEPLYLKLKFLCFKYILLLIRNFILFIPLFPPIIFSLTLILLLLIGP